MEVDTGVIELLELFQDSRDLVTETDVVECRVVLRTRSRNLAVGNQISDQIIDNGAIALS